MERKRHRVPKSSMTKNIHWLLVWFAASVAALIVALLPVYAALVNGHYIPVGNDSFYHARRILDLLADPTSLHEFDTHIHAPEGSLLIWPWGYDYAMSMLVRLGLALGVSADPMAVLDHVPVFAFPMCLALVLVVCRQLGLSLGATATALFATALFPLNERLYAVGNVDHHFAEQLFVLSTLALGMGWLRNPDSAFRAVGLGSLLGVAHCIHNGLFILQLPIALALLLMWIGGIPRPATTWKFAVALGASTLAVALPSTALRLGRFDFFALSWFHVYFAACVGVGSVLLQKTTLSRKGVVIVGLTVALMALPVLSQTLLAGRFLSVSIEGAERINEQQSVWDLAGDLGGLRGMFGMYTYLVVLLPAALIVAAWRAWRGREPHEILFWIATALGLTLLASMIRMHPFGSFALYMTWVVLVDERVRAGKWQARPALLGLGLILLIAYVPGLQSTFTGRKTQSNDPYYALAHELYERLGEECAKHPGIALATLDDGNYLRYHTDCQIIANNFLLTPQHEAKVREVRELMSLSAAELRQRAPHVRYVLARRSTLFQPTQGGIAFVPGGVPELDYPLVNELLAASPELLPPGFRIVQELAFEKPQHVTYARLFAIE